MPEMDKSKIAVLGASGGVGKRIVERALARGFDVACQTRDATRLAGIAGRVRVHTFDPRDAGKLGEFVRGADAVVFALGVDTVGATTLFSEATKALISAMKSEHVKRLIAITGVGAGETRGHGGFIYDRIVFPLFTRKRYQDKNRQAAMIAASGLDWIVVRPAPFAEIATPGALEVHTAITPDTVLGCATRDEVAAFVVDQIGSDRYLRQTPFIGHPPSTRGLWVGFKAAIAYFAIAFAVGFVLGGLRELVLVPRIGETIAVAAELPIMLAVSWIACRQVVAHFSVGDAWAPRLVMGGGAFTFLMAAEFGVSVLAFDRTVVQHIATYRTPASALGLAAQIFFALIPVIQWRPWRRVGRE